jgi:hypothetical protein
VTEATRVHSEIETDRIRDAISDYWGEECPEKDADCACCKAWAQLAALERQLADYKAAAEAEAHAGDEARAENKLLREAATAALKGIDLLLMCSLPRDVSGEEMIRQAREYRQQLEAALEQTK